MSAPVTGVSDRVRNQLTLLLARSGLPKKLVDRCLNDIDGRPHYERVASIEEIQAQPPNSSYWGTSCTCCCSEGVLVEQGKLGKLRVDDQFIWLAPGYHKFSTLGSEYLGEVETAVFNKAQVHGSSGFVTISEGYLGVLLVGAEYRLLAPGTFNWNSSSVRFVNCVDTTASVAKLGPFHLVTVPEGMVAVTYLNGDLRILGDKASQQQQQHAAASAAPSAKSEPAQIIPGTSVSGAIQRTFFLDDPKWTYSAFLSLKTQTDKLKDVDCLSSDNVEILMTAMSQWRIKDPVLAITECGDDMATITDKCSNLVRATIARIVAATAIGHNVSGATASHSDKVDEGADLSHLMQSDSALIHMKDLSANLRRMGLEVLGVFVPEKRMKNDDIRREVARQAVIGIKAEAERAAADAKAYSTITNARAEAEAISELAKAHADAGKLLGDSTTTASRLALSEVVGKSFKDAKITLFSGNVDKMPFMFSPEMK